MAAKLKIQSGAGKDVEWAPDMHHRVHPDLVGQNKYWWVVVADGIYRLSMDKPFRTKGSPGTLKRVRKNLGDQIDRAIDSHGQVLWTPKGYEKEWTGESMDSWDADRYDDLRVMVAAVLANENGGKLKGDRFEKHINDWSFGPAQFLTATAHFIARKYKLEPTPAFTMRKIGTDANKKAWKKYLEDPDNACALEVCYLCDLSKRFALKGDPVLTYASYNAGSPRPTRKRTPWGLVAWDKDGLGPIPGALDHFVKWYGDACAVFR